MIANSLHILSKEDFDVIIKFLEKNNDTTISIIQPMSDLISLIIRKVDTVVFDTIMKYDIDVNTITIAEWTPLILASYHGLPYFVEKLLQKGAKVSPCEKNGDSALSICLTPPLTYNKIKCAKLLIKAGSDIERFSNQGDNQAYYIALLLKENMDLEKIPRLVGCQTIDIRGATDVHVPNCHRIHSNDYTLIRAIKANPDVTQEKIPRNTYLTFIGENNSTHIFNASTMIAIELPFPGEKIIGHILLPDMKLISGSITKPMIVRCKDIICVKNINGELESFFPSSIYY